MCQFLRRQIRCRRPCAAGFRIRQFPAGSVPCSSVGIVCERIPRHLKIPHVGVPALFQFRRSVPGIFQHKFHVGLPAGKPDFPECHVGKFLFVYRQGTARARRHRRQCHPPCSVLLHRRRNGTVPLGNGNSHRLPCGARPENGNGLAPLEQHVVCKNGCTMYHMNSTSLFFQTARHQTVLFECYLYYTRFCRRCQRGVLPKYSHGNQFSKIC